MPSANLQPGTYVVLGIFRGGTSAVAGTLRILGVDMGYVHGRTDHEDPMLIDEFDLDVWRKYIQARNSNEQTYGFKQPNTVRFFDEIEPYLKNPRYVLVYRNPEDIANSEHKHVGLERQESLDRTQWWYDRMQNIEQSDRDTVTLHYEHLARPNFTGTDRQRESAENLYAFVTGKQPTKRNKTVQKVIDFWNRKEYSTL